MKLKILIILILLYFGFLQPVLAKSGIYITAESGWANQTGLPPASNVQATRIDQSHAPIWRLGLGYLHDFNSIFGLGFEAGGGGYRGTTYCFSSGSKTDTYSSTMEFLAVLALHQQPLDYFVKLGALRHTLSGSTLKGNSDTNETKIQPEITAGINYNFNEHFALTSEYLHSFGSSMNHFFDQEWQSPSLNAVLVGVKVSFW